MIIVDEEDKWRLAAFNWLIQPAGPQYAYRNVRANGKKCRIYLHREILDALPGVMVYHRNADGMDCRRQNLRTCTHAENMRNRRTSKSNKLGVKGVWQKKNRESSFIAEIKADGKKHRLGTFKTIEAAARAYAEAAKRLHGEFARVTGGYQP